MDGIVNPDAHRGEREITGKAEENRIVDHVEHAIGDDAIGVERGDPGRREDHGRAPDHAERDRRLQPLNGGDPGDEFGRQDDVAEGEERDEEGAGAGAEENLAARPNAAAEAVEAARERDAERGPFDPARDRQDDKRRNK